MILKQPFFISSRLLPALEVNGSTIQLTYNGRLADGRNCFEWTIDLEGEEYIGHGLFCHGNLQRGFIELIAWLYTAGELYADNSRYEMKVPTEPIFPQPVMAWAAKNIETLMALEESLKSQTVIFVTEAVK